MASAIEVRDLRKHYGDVEAVRGISFDVAEGEVVAILGPNGAGKTTTVEILEGYRERTSGSVQVLGTDPATAGPDWRNRVGIVLQECGIDAYLTVAEVVTMHAEYYARPRDPGEVIDLVGLDEKAGSRVKTLSGGQQRRLDVALGLIGDPDLLFLDEPTTGFDPTARRQSWEIVRNLTSLGKTVLLTTHYMDEAQYLADRVIVIARGLVVAEGTPASIGGRETDRTTIRFALATGVELGPPPFGVRADDTGLWTHTTTDPTADVHRLTGWALDAGVRFESLTVDRPSLEDVYLRLTADPEVAS